MDLEIPQEFCPITPIQIIPTTSGNYNSTNKKTRELSSTQEQEQEDEEDQCKTPKSEDNLLKESLICPPAPMKPRPPKRKNGLSSSSSSWKGYFRVPSDLNSVFFSIPTSRDYNSTTTTIASNNNKENMNINECQLKFTDLEKNFREELLLFEEEDDECSTPKCEDNLLKTPLICPPAPKKIRPMEKRNELSSSNEFFQVPIDLESVFLAIPNSNKKIKLTG